MTSILNKNGQYEHSFRQSWIKNLVGCPEQARRLYFDEIEDWETDAASVGTAVHSAIEQALKLPQDGTVFEDDVAQSFHNAFSHQMALPNFRWVKYDEDQARSFGERCARKWYQEMYHQLEPEVVELRFENLLVHEDEIRKIFLEGTIDYIDKHFGIVDWKTAGRPWTAWSVKQNQKQADVYSLAAAMLGLLPDSPLKFTFCVMNPDGIQTFPADLSAANWRWIVRSTLNAAKLIEANAQAWPVDDSYFLCSEKWCPNWRDCKGAVVADTTFDDLLEGVA